MMLIDLALVLVGAATRLSQILTGLPKRYAGTIRLGLTTDTDDATGAPRAASGAAIIQLMGLPVRARRDW